MKKLIFFPLISLLMMSACKSDDDAGPFSGGLYHWDGNNQSAPELDPGDYEAATRFPADVLSDVKGKHITEVRYFIGFKPAACAIKIYASNGGSEPDTLLYQANTTNGITETSWNTHTLTRDVVIGDEDIWIAVALTHDIKMQSIGCDTGPAVEDGDWLYQASDNDWLFYHDRTPVSINWNIRMQVE